MEKFNMLSENELLDIDGGVCGIDDGLLLTAFLAAMAIARQ